MDMNPLPRHLVWKGFRQAIWPAVRYVLPAMSLSHSDAQILSKKIYQPLLPKLGCNRNFPLLLRYNPTHLWGLNLPDPYVEQGIAKLQMLLSYGGSTTITGKLLQTLLEQHQLEVGSFKQFLVLDYKQHGFLTPSSWLSELWQFISLHKITLHQSDIPPPAPQRQYDRAIMECFMADHNLAQPTLIAINRVRCHLQVLALADIATGDGKMITHNALHGIPLHGQSRWRWHKEKPTTHDFKIWRESLMLLLTPTGNLRQPLGPWTGPAHRCNPWSYHQSSDVLYQQSGNQWRRYNTTGCNTRHNRAFQATGLVPSIPFDSHFATVSAITETSVRLESASTSFPPIAPSIPTIQRKHKWIFSHSTNEHATREAWFARGLSQGTLLAVCDGSYKPYTYKHGCSAGWILEDATRQHSIKGTAAIAGTKADAYRGELLGIYGILMTIWNFELRHPAYSKGSLRVGCDNEKAGLQSGYINIPPRYHQAHIDIIKAIRRLQLTLRTSISFFHIYGHQDTHTSYCRLSWEAQLNVQADALAQQHLEWAFEHSTFVKHPNFAFEGWTISLGGAKMVDSHKHHIHEWIGNHRLRQYLVERGYSWATFSRLSFSPLASHLSQQPQSFQLWYAKHCTNFCGIGHKMKQMKRWKNDLCPCCQQFSETTTAHLFICPERTMMEKRQQLYADILKWLETADICPILYEIISQFWHGKPVILDRDTPYIYRQMYQTLVDIGVGSMWNGMLPATMIDIQDSYYKVIGSNKTGHKWATSFVGRILKATHTLWLHRNSMLHIQSDHGMPGMDMVQLREEVNKQMRLGTDNMSKDDWHLLEVNPIDLMAESIDSIRGWLCDVYIARGQYQDAVEEGKLDRVSTTIGTTSVTAQQRKEFLDWRNIRLHKRATSDDYIEA